ncbi:MAG: alkaline phosphatase D family protein [Fibrobacteria bacterium]
MGKRTFSGAIILASMLGAQATAGAASGHPANLPLDADNQELVRLGKHSARKTSPALPDFFDAALKPFYHGVASGDPLPDRVIIWTRITPDRNEACLPVKWMVSTDPDFSRKRKRVQEGEYQATAERDFTVKVDVTGLRPGTTYYYKFDYKKRSSLVGRTKTAPVKDPGHLQFAVTSCANYQAGYFNAYANIAMRKDLDAVISLGDYFYEYEEGGYGFTDAVGRGHEPKNEILTLEDYRTRHSFYKLDPDLRAAHQQHPWIVVWDDHESANDSYRDGAENHNEGEGDWELRKRRSKRAYFEWMPIREHVKPKDGNIHRKLSYGPLADFFMLDTRLEGRDKQPTSMTDPSLTDPDRTMLGLEQRNWLLDGLKASSAKWKVIGNQVIFAPLNLGFAAGFGDVAHPGAHITNLDSINAIESVFLDIWDGYPAERSKIINFIRQAEIKNTVILTGDFHCAFSFDVTDIPVVYPNPAANNLPTPSASYDPATGAGSAGVEFATPSITSANFDENIGAPAAAAFQASINSVIPVPFPLPFPLVYNPHMKYVDLTRHGYYLLSLDGEKAQADYYFVNTILERNNAVTLGANGSWMAADGADHLTPAAAPYPSNLGPGLAPLRKTSADGAGSEAIDGQALAVLSQGWSDGSIHLHFSLAHPARVSIELADALGKIVLTRSIQAEAGLYQWRTESAGLGEGQYFLKVGLEGAQSVSKHIRIGKDR